MGRAKSQIYTVGDLSIVYSHPLILGARQIGWTGFKVESDIFDAEQIMDNSKVVPLIGGIVAIITNTIGAGYFTVNVTRGDGDMASGDVVAAMHYLRKLGDSVGGTLRASQSQNGQTRYVTFYDVVLKRVKALKIQGNDVPDYGCQCNFSDYDDN